MRAEVASTQASSSPPPAAPDLRAFAELFDAHAHHLFDYCSLLLGDGVDAIRATQATLITGYALIGKVRDPSRLRAWLFALAHRECTSKDPARAELRAQIWVGELADDDAAPPTTARATVAYRSVAKDAAAGQHSIHDTEATAKRGARSIPPAFSSLSAAEREVLDLVYRHDVGVSNVPTILGSSENYAQNLLANAVMRFQLSRALSASFDSSRAPDSDSAGSGLEQISTVPLTPMPASLWRQTARAVADDGLGSFCKAVAAHAGRLGPNGFPVQPTATSGRRRHRRLAIVTALLFITLAGGAAAVAYAAGAIRAVNPPPRTALITTPGSSPKAATSSPAAHKHRHHTRAHRKKHRRHNTATGRSSSTLTTPAHQTSTKPNPTPPFILKSPPPTTPAPTPTPTPSPTATPTA